MTPTFLAGVACYERRRIFSRRHLNNRFTCRHLSSDAELSGRVSRVARGDSCLPKASESAAPSWNAEGATQEI